MSTQVVSPSLSVQAVLQKWGQAEVSRRVKKLSPEKQELARQMIALDLMSRPVASFDSGPLYWLTKFTKTEDEHWFEKGTQFISPFPRKEYFLPVMQHMIDEKVLFIQKSREMMTSWEATGFATWGASKVGLFWLFQSEKDDKVIQLVNYARILHRNQPKWLIDQNPLIVDNDHELMWKRGGKIVGIPGGADQVRSWHPYGLISDESAFQQEFEASFNSAKPVCKKIICISTDAMGPFHTICKEAA